MAVIRSGTLSSQYVTYQQLGTGETPRLVQDRLRDIISVKDFGAVGNGSGDDTAAIRAAVAAVPATGGTVFLPAGTYPISAVIQLATAGGPVRFIGAGRNATILLAKAVGYDGINPMSYGYIGHMTIRGASSSPGGGIGIDAGSTNFLTLEDLIIENWPGDNINSGGTSSYWKIDNVVSRNSGGESVLITANSNYWQISNYTAYGNRFNAIDMSGVGHTLSNIILYQNGGSNVASAGDQDGILIVSDTFTPVTSDITITNLYCHQNNTHGIRIESGANTVIKRIKLSNVVSSNNGTGDGGVNPITRYGDGLIITNSNSATSSTEAIQDISISGITVDNNFRHGLIVVSNDGNPTPVKRINVTGVSALNHTQWTGGPPGSTGIQLYGAHLLNTKVSGQSVANTNNIYVGTNVPAGNLSLDVQTDDASGGSSIISVGAGAGINGAILSSSSNTELRLQSTFAGTRPYGLAIDQFGEFAIIDRQAAIVRMTINSAGNAIFAGALAIGGGSFFTKSVTGSAILDFPSTPAQSASDLTAPFTGAVIDHPVAVVPSGGVWSMSGFGFYIAACLADDVVTIRFVNQTAAAIDPVSGQFTFFQLQF